MTNLEPKKCKKCGATLVGKKAQKGGFCSNCARETGQKAITIGAVATFALAGLSKILKAVSKRI